MKRKLIIVLLIISFFLFLIFLKFKDAFKINIYKSLNESDLSMSILDKNIFITSEGIEMIYKIKVNNNSSIDVTYEIMLDDLPNNIEAKLDNNEYIKEVNDKISFVNYRKKLSKNSYKEHELTFIVPKNIEDNDYIANINIIFSQKVS